MNQQKYEALRTVQPKIITGENLQNKTPRTLLYGYTCERDTWHVFLNDMGEIETVLYSGGEGQPLNQMKIRVNQDFVPDKRLYAEKCDFEFCKLLVERSVHLPFTSPDFDAEFERKPFYGRTGYYD